MSYFVQVTITNKENGKSETKTEDGLDEDEVQAQLKEWGQHLESGDDWFELFDDDEEEETCEHCGEALEECEATWYPEETFRDDERAMFAWKHLGWGVRQPVNREQTAQEA